MNSKILFILLLFVVMGRQGIAQTLQYQDSPFGLNEGYWPGRPGHPSTVEKMSEAMKDIGVKWARVFVVWGVIEPNKDEFDWTGYDEIVLSAEVHGINLLINIQSKGVIWDVNYISQISFKPADMEAYEVFVEKLVERYDNDGIDDMPGIKYGVKYWEALNEVESPGYFKGTISDYVQVHLATYSAIKKSDSSAHILIAGMVSQANPQSLLAKGVVPYYDENKDWHVWFDNLFTLGTGDYFDITNYHMYKMDFREHTSYYTNQLPKPLWITETGTTSSPNDRNPSATEKTQAQEVVKRTVMGIATGAEKVFWHKLTGVSEGGTTFGVLTENFTPKLSHYTYKKMVEVLERSDWSNIQTIQESSGIYIYKFTKQGTPIWVAWNDSSLTKTITISGISSNRVKKTEAIPKYESGKDVTDYATAFQTDTLNVTNDAVTLTLGARPMFIEPLTITSVEDQDQTIPEEFVLYQNYPNPFNPTTTIRFSLPQREHVTLKVFDVLGREVAMLVDEELNAGEHSVLLNAERLSSGIYIYKPQAGSIVHQKKMTVLK